nr:hypothetical protein [Tanacetum cinerariifolium]
VAIGQKANFGVLGQPEIVVAHHHDVVAGLNLLLGLKQGAPDELVVLIGVAVRAANDGRVFVPKIAVGPAQAVLQLVAAHLKHILEALGMQPDGGR